MSCQRCGGWGILVDDITRKKYENCGKEPGFGICMREDGSIQLIHEKCPLLTEDGYAVLNKYGEKMLCDTCKVYQGS